MLNAELDQHLEAEAAVISEGAGTGNHRDGYSKKTVITDTSQVGLDANCDDQIATSPIFPKILEYHDDGVSTGETRT